MQKKIDWIDCLKGYGAILVILGHLNPHILLECYIYSFHMPLFFFLAGLLRKEQEHLKTFLVKKVKSLLVPLAVWDFTVCIAFMIVGRGDKISLLQGAFFISGMRPINTPIWFLLTLFICEITYNTLTTIRIPNFLIIGAAFLITPFVCELNTLPFTLNLVVPTMFFYGLGALLRPKLLKSRVSLAQKCMIPVLTIVSIIFGGVLNSRISMANGYFGNITYFLIAAVSGVLMWVLIFRLLPPNRILIRIGQQSLFLMCIQYPVFIALSSISKKFFDYDIWHEVGTLKAVLVTIFVLLISFTVLWIADKIGKRYPKITKIFSWFGIRPIAEKSNNITYKKLDFGETHHG